MCTLPGAEVSLIWVLTLGSFRSSRKYEIYWSDFFCFCFFTMECWVSYRWNEIEVQRGNECFWLGGLLFIQQCDCYCVLIGIFSKEIWSSHWSNNPSKICWKPRIKEIVKRIRGKLTHHLSFFKINHSPVEGDRHITSIYSKIWDVWCICKGYKFLLIVC